MDMIHALQAVPGGFGSFGAYAINPVHTVPVLGAGDLPHVLLFELFDTNKVQGWLDAAGPVVGPIIIFSLLFACGLGLPLPEDIPLLAGGFFVAHGKMSLAAVAILAWTGIIGGDCVLYHLGKKYGLNITKVPFVGKHLTKQRILKAERLFERWGIWVVAIGRLVAGIRGAMVVAAGATRFSFVKFVIADGIAALISGGLFVWLGWFLGRQFGTLGEIAEKIKPYQTLVILGIAGAVILFLLYKWWSARKHRTVTDVALEKAVEVAEHAHAAGPDAVAK